MPAFLICDFPFVAHKGIDFIRKKLFYKKAILLSADLLHALVVKINVV
jgi:hypothetical protein